MSAQTQTGPDRPTGWHGYDWLKLAVAGALAATLLPFGGQPAAPAPAASAPTAAPAPAAPEVVPAATVAPAAAAPAAAPAATPAATLPVIDAPQILTTREAVLAGPYTVRGTGTPGSTVEVLVDGAVVGTATVGDDGRWALETTLAAGERAIAARAVDAQGNTLAEREAVRLNVGEAPVVAVPPIAILPGVAVPAEGAQLPAGRTTVSGAGEPGTTLEILNGDQLLGEATVASDGTWSAEVELASGTASIGVRPKGQTDLASPPVRVDVDGGQVDACAGVAVGCPAWVTRAGGLVLRMREGPGTSSAIITRLPIGTEMEVLDGPRPADGFTWWRVRTTGGSEGWVSGENLVPQPD